jgi:hypothetical protein
MLKKATFLVCFVAATLVAGHVSQASTIVGNLYGGVENGLSDNSGEFLFNRSGGTTTLDVGDVIITGFTIDDVTNTTNGDFFKPGTGTVNALNGISAIEVIGFDAATKTIIFGSLDAGALAAIAADPNMAALSGVISTWSAGTMVALYDAGSPALSFDRQGALGVDDGDLLHAGSDIGSGPFLSESLRTTTASAGTLILEAGFTGAAGEYWVATASAATPFASFLDIAIAATRPVSGNLGTVNFALNKTGGVVDLDRVEDNGAGILVDFAGNANIHGTSKGNSVLANRIATSYDIFDDLNGFFTPTAVVPEPGSILIFGGLAFAGLLGIRRKGVGRTSGV